MEFRTHLQKRNRKSPQMIILGIVAVSFSIFTLVRHHMVPTMHYAPILDAVAYGVMFVIGCVFTYAGFGWSLTRLLGKSFIAIDHESISIKKCALGDVQSILWKDIKTLEYRSESYFIVLHHNEELMIDLSNLNDEMLKDIRTTILRIGMEKGKAVSDRLEE